MKNSKGLTPTNSSTITITLILNSLVYIHFILAPTSIQAPTLSLLQPTTLSVVWVEPETPNGIIMVYIIKYNPTNLPNLVTSIQLNPGLTGYQVENLSPHQNYSITITACTVGCAESSASVIQTGQVLASGLSEILVEALSATELFVTWSVPIMPNGIISGYTLYRKEGNGNFGQIAQGKYIDYFLKCNDYF